MPSLATPDDVWCARCGRPSYDQRTVDALVNGGCTNLSEGDGYLLTDREGNVLHDCRGARIDGQADG